MTARISLILGKTRGHRPRLQMLLHEFRNTLDIGGVAATSRRSREASFNGADGREARAR